jgi:hypothetical protein
MPMNFLSKYYPRGFKENLALFKIKAGAKGPQDPLYQLNSYRELTPSPQKP